MQKSPLTMIQTTRLRQLIFQDLGLPLSRGEMPTVDQIAIALINPTQPGKIPLCDYEGSALRGYVSGLKSLQIERGWVIHELTIPFPKIRTAHTVLLGFNFSCCPLKIIYMDPNGLEIPQELQDVLTSAFPGVPIDASYNYKQQEMDETDCGLISAFNAARMACFLTGSPQPDLPMTSREAREFIAIHQLDLK